MYPLYSPLSMCGSYSAGIGISFSNFFKISKPYQFLRIIAKTLVILLIFCGGFQRFHKPIDFSMASMDDKSKAGLLRNAPLWTSSIAASVSALGS